MGLPPDSSSTLFWGRNRATTLMLFGADMLGAVCTSHEGRYHRPRRSTAWRIRGGSCEMRAAGCSGNARKGR